MITRIKISNFTCHEKTEITLSEGLTIFLGRNGSGKSSIIDAITYALYGKHTRGSKENMVRDGSDGGEVELEFDFKGRHYKVRRIFNARGELENAALWEEDSLLVVGERKRDEAVSAMVEKLFGLSYERMRTAVVIQQGELDRILSAEPRELKELFDDLMGLTAMEKAYQNMHEILRDFERRIINEAGRSIEEADRIDDEMRMLESNLKALDEERSRIMEELPSLKGRLSIAENRLRELSSARELEEEFRISFERLMRILDKKIQQLSMALGDASKRLKLIELRDEVESRLRRLEELSSEIQEIERMLASLKGREGELSKTLRELEKQIVRIEVGAAKMRSLDELLMEARAKAEKLRDDSIELGKTIASHRGQESLLRLQVDQEVEEIVGIISEAYKSGLMGHVAELAGRREKVQEELEEVRSEASKLREKLRALEDERARLSKLMGEDLMELRGRIRSAEDELKAIGSPEEIARQEEALRSLRGKMDMLEKFIGMKMMPEDSIFNEISVLLEGEEQRFLSQLRDTASKLKETRYDPEELKRLESERSELIKKISENEGRLASLERDIENTSARLEDLRRVKDALLEAKRFRELLEKIRNELYHRDGPVLKSLRKWILGKVAEHARRYLDIFDIRIDDVNIVEDDRTINFRCYYRGREIDVERLSGGEKVALALAIRLAIGDVLGARRLGFFILDEPTVHLDAENRRRLIEVFTSLGKAVRQSIIITHDEELFEGVEARIVRFERGLEADAPAIVHVLG